VLQNLRVLNFGVTLSGADVLLEPIASAYRRFAVSQPLDGALRLEVEAPGTEARVNGRLVALVPGLDPTFQIYQLFLNCVMDRIDSHAVLHGAALRDGRGGGLVLAAPSGHGKSSLTLELAYRGLGFLGDDYAPLNLANRLVAPYPRAVGVASDSEAPMPEAFRRPAADPSAPQLLGKSLLDVGDVLGEDRLAAEPVPLQHVLLLTADRQGSGPWPATWVQLASRTADAEELEAFFAATEGVEIIERLDRPHVRLWRLRLEHERRPTEALSRVLDSDRVLFAEKYWDKRPDFSGTPEAVPIRRREAAEFLGRELLNRRLGGRLLASYGGKLTPLFVDLAAALREAACWRIRVGGCRETADLIQRLVA
jgi:hypothetical protein